MKNIVMRVARPTDNLTKIAEMYKSALEFSVLAEFENHEGFDGIILGHPEQQYHLEFTHHQGTKVGKAPTKDNLLVFYIPDPEEWEVFCRQMRESGFIEVKSYNPYWDEKGKTFEDIDGYRVVIQNYSWES